MRINVHHRGTQRAVNWPFIAHALAFALCVLSSQCSWAAETILVKTNAVWKYLDDGSDQGIPWSDPAFDDSLWQSGPSQLGYGDGDESTVVNCGPFALCNSNNFVTTYFRRAFTVPNPSAYVAVRLGLLRDDGAVVYLNGTEVRRDNLPAGPITYTTLAATDLPAGAEKTFFSTLLSSNVLAQGVNVLAVEVHQRFRSSSDMSFAVELVGIESIEVNRGPYLQRASPTNLVVRWRTNLPTDSCVRFGTDPGMLDRTACDPIATLEHKVTLTGLTPATKYYYSVGSSTEEFAGGQDFFFVTPPLVGTPRPTRIWVLGDSGTADDFAAAVRDAYITYTGTRYTDLVLMLGDNAYPSGTDLDYQRAVFDMYPSVLRQSVLWPTIGNHDTSQSTNATPNLPYLNIFALPTQGEAGGMPSGTERYYSFDFANIHFICLDSMTSARTLGSPMLDWLESDLAATTNDWIIAFWHHPPYSKGSHDSDVDVELTEMRENAVPILEAAGVDLVLCGHSHSYERSYLINGHYGTASTFTEEMKVSGASGRGKYAYRKPVTSPSANQGAVYVVAGNSGQVGFGSFNHPAMFMSKPRLGSLVLDITGGRLDATFLRQTGKINDTFTILKDIPNVRPSVTLLEPQEGAVFNELDPVPISADAVDPDGALVQVDFFVDDSYLGSTTNAPHSVTWTNSMPGNHAIMAVAMDNLGTRTATAPVTITVITPRPAAASGLTATAIASDQIDLMWNDNADNEQGFRIRRSTSGQLFSTIGTVGTNVTSYSDTSCGPGTKFYYRVRSFNQGGWTADSNTASATTPP